MVEFRKKRATFRPSKGWIYVYYNKGNGTLNIFLSYMWIIFCNIIIWFKWNIATSKPRCSTKHYQLQNFLCLFSLSAFKMKLVSHSFSLFRFSKKGLQFCVFFTNFFVPYISTFTFETMKQKFNRIVSFVFQMKEKII